MAWSVVETLSPTFHDHSLIVSGDAAVLYGMCGLRLRDGREIRLSSTHLFSFEMVLIINHRVEYDTLAFSQALPRRPDSLPP
jgi:hypothetical protein